MPRSDEPLEFLVDRSLGRTAVPAALAEAGLVVHTLRSVFGPGAEELVPDVEWLQRAATEGWAILTKDERIRRVPLEREAVRRGGLRVFYVANANLRGMEQADRIVRNLPRITALARKPGPAIYAIHSRSVVRMFPRP